MTECLPNFAAGRWQAGSGAGAALFDPAISSDVAALHTGHGNVLPQSLHGGPGRAAGGEELGGLRALSFPHRHAAIQASTTVLSALATAAAS